MFCSMKLKEKVKCIMEMILLVIVLIIAFSIIDAIVDALILSWFSKVPGIGYELRSILFNLIIIISLIIGLIIFIHLFKIRYLDYFITIEDNNVNKKTIEEPLDKNKEKDYIYEKAKKERIIIRDPKHSSMSFYNLLSKMIILILKFFACIFIVPIIFTFVFLIILGVISLYHTMYAVIFLTISFGLLGASIICYCLIEFLYNFIVSKVIKFKKIFILSIISLIVIGTSIGLTCISLLNYDYVEDTSNLDLITKTEYISINSNTLIFPHIGYNYNDNEYIIDNTIEKGKVKVEINTLKENNYNINSHKEKNFEIYNIYPVYDINFKDAYDLILNDLKNKIIRDYGYLSQTKMYLSQDTYNILEKNYNNYKEQYDNYEDEDSEDEYLTDNYD